MQIVYPLINYSSTLQIKCSAHLIYISIITYACPVWAIASQTEIKIYIPDNLNQRAI